MRSAAAAWLLLLASLQAACAGPSSQAALRLSEYRYEPARVRAAAGQPFTLTVVNEGKTAHNLVVEFGAGEPTVALEVLPGRRQALTFTAPAPGSYRFVCTIPGHSSSGMTGVLLVE